MDVREIRHWLCETDDGRLQDLWRLADATRRRYVGDAVHLRGLTEFSNVCVRRCAYCGLGAHNADLKRYRMADHEILACAHRAVEHACGTIVLQAGQDHGWPTAWLADSIRRIKNETPLAVTLSVGERDTRELAAWRQAGADRYLLRFETSDRALYDRIHPPLSGERSDRIAILRVLRDLGYEVGSGVMIGLPGQTFATLARDIHLFGELGLDMIGCGPYIPSPSAPLGRHGDALLAPADQQVPNNEAMACKVIALARLVCPRANIPVTTAVAVLNGETGYELGLQRGANVIMPNVTPAGYRDLYAIYPAKADVGRGRNDRRLLRQRVHAIGRRIGTGRGDSAAYRSRRPRDVEASTCAR